MLLLLLSATGCDRSDRPDSSQQPSESTDAQLPHHDFTDLSPDQIVDLTEPDEDAFITPEVGGTQMFSECREIFEEDGEILPWPLAEHEVSAAIFGCDPDGYIEFDDGRRAIAYPVPIPDQPRATNLRIILFDNEGDPLWHQRMDRSREINNFAANYRGSFLTRVDDRLLCAGTRWQAGTQMICARLESGNIVYDGRMKFWAGIKPFAFDGSIFSADLNGITQRYPFSGAEMRHRTFGERGGRAGFYATDEERIYFVPSRGDTVLSGWDLATMKKIWTADVAAVPKGNYSETHAEHGLLLLIVDETLLGVDATSGQLRMAFDVGTATPPAAFSEDELYLLVRRIDESPLLYALDPDDGAIRWVTEAPAGSLRLHHDGDVLMTRSVHTVRTIEAGVPR